VSITLIDVKKEVAKIISDKILKEFSIKIDEEKIFNLFSQTKNSDLGDFCLPLFMISKELNINPSNLSNSMQQYLQNLFSVEKNLMIEKVSPAGPYLNFWVNKKEILLKLIQSNDFNLFHKDTLKDYTVVIDYSSCNIAKPYGIGHIMSTAIGESLKRCYEYLGSNVVGINYIGDWGTQFGKVLLAYELWGEQKELEEKGVYYLYELYVKIHKEEENNPDLIDKAKEIFQKLESKDEHYYKLWEKIKEISLNNFNQYYTLFGNTFTLTEGESKYNKKSIDDVIRILDLNQILKESEGAKVVFLNEIYKNENIPPCIIIKSDGTTTYALRDIAAILDRWQRFHFDEALYVINVSQSMHIKQFKGVLKELNFPFAEKIFHVAFGTMTFSGQKMQTRKGTILFLQDIFNEIYNQAISITREKNIAQNFEDTAKKLAVGAIVFAILKNQRIKDIDFDFSKVLNFEGDTAAYLQYTAVRINSILKKASEDLKIERSQISVSNDNLVESVNKFFFNVTKDVTKDLNQGKDENLKILKDILFELYRFDEVIDSVVKEKEPYLLSRYLLKLANLFNQFYVRVRILEGENQEIILKLKFIEKIGQCLKNGLRLLGIEVPESL